MKISFRGHAFHAMPRLYNNDELSSHLRLLNMCDGTCPHGGEEKLCGLVSLYAKIQKTIEVSATEGNKNSVTIMIDDISLLKGCTLVILSHEEVYSSMEKPMLMLQMEYFANVLIKAEALATGLASDVHGQLTVVNMGRHEPKGSLKTKKSNFQFKFRENNVECLYPGSRI
ncbi:Elongator complex protein 6 [Dillenia turbinata]|uniref:Elongator complex protein 6 n=1 Tax=Dillenia turbinata TaxID=194707 RepID=A0AAN8VPG9_9MAGN